MDKYMEKVWKMSSNIFMKKRFWIIMQTDVQKNTIPICKYYYNIIVLNTNVNAGHSISQVELYLFICLFVYLFIYVFVCLFDQI